MHLPQWPTVGCLAQRGEPSPVYEARAHRRDHREQAQRMPVRLAQDAKGVEPAHPMLDMPPHGGLLAIRGPRRRRQLPAARFALGDLDASRADRGQGSLLHCIGAVFWDSTPLVEPFGGGRAWMARVNGKPRALDLGGHLRLEGMAFLLPP